MHISSTIIVFFSFLCALLCGTSFNSAFRVHSYSDVNTHYSNSYQKYSKDIPQFLHHRPQDLVKQCLEKMTLAAIIDTSEITNKGGGKFALMSFSGNQKERYELAFGDTLSMPKCSCIDWNRTGYPCKHFFAVFNKYLAWSWNDLSKLYTESLFLNLDLEIVRIANFDIDDKDIEKK